MVLSCSYSGSQNIKYKPGNPIRRLQDIILLRGRILQILKVASVELPQIHMLRTCTFDIWQGDIAIYFLHDLLSNSIVFLTPIKQNTCSNAHEKSNVCPCELVWRSVGRFMNVCLARYYTFHILYFMLYTFFF